MRPVALDVTLSTTGLIVAGCGWSPPGQVLFCDHDALIGTPTPGPRPYVNVVTSGDTVSVQNQWKQGNDQPCCPTGIGTVRLQPADGKLKALDPVPNV